VAPHIWRILMILGALLYVLSPVDLTPDLMPVWGWLDDLLVLALLLWFLTRAGADPHGASGGPTTEEARGAKPTDPYAVLEVDQGATAEEVRAAYRRMVGQYHPDKVAHLGKELQEMAHQKLIAVQQAYEALMGMRTEE
jgi:hypothetical protein